MVGSEAPEVGFPLFFCDFQEENAEKSPPFFPCILLRNEGTTGQGEKMACMIKAQEDFPTKSGKPIFIPITRVNEGQNPNKEHFGKCFEAAGKGTPTTPLPRAAAADRAETAAGGANSPIAAEKARLARMSRMSPKSAGGAVPMTPREPEPAAAGGGEGLEHFKHAVQEVEMIDRVLHTLADLQK